MFRLEKCKSQSSINSILGSAFLESSFKVGNLTCEARLLKIVYRFLVDKELQVVIILKHYPFMLSI